MSTMLATLALLTLGAALVGFILKAKNLGMSSSMERWEDDEQMRLIRTTSGGSEPDVVATLH